MKYVKHCQRKYVESIKNGEKTVEGRLFRGDWAVMTPGDTLILYDEQRDEKQSGGAEEKKERGEGEGGRIDVCCEIVKLVRMPSFQALFDEFGQRLLPGECDASAYRQFATKEEENQFGVVGVVLKIVSPE